MYDIYRRMENGDIVWIRAFDTLEQAHAYLNGVNADWREMYKIEPRTETPKSA